MTKSGRKRSTWNDAKATNEVDSYIQMRMSTMTVKQKFHFLKEMEDAQKR